LLSAPPNYFLPERIENLLKANVNYTKKTSLKPNFMKYNFVPIVFSVAALLLSCQGKKTEDTAVVERDTTVIRDTVVQTVTQPVDTAAIIAAYEAQYAKTKSKDTKPVYKEKAEKQVTAYPEPEIQSVAPAEVEVDMAGYHYIADTHASYPGGRPAFLKYFYKNFEYPERAIENNIQGTVYAEVFISETGDVEKVEFPGRKLGYGLEDEARRVLMGVDKVNPATKNGAPAKERYVLPIRVAIQD
jgi:periplasmic protein TonB